MMLLSTNLQNQGATQLHIKMTIKVHLSINLQKVILMQLLLILPPSIRHHKKLNTEPLLMMPPSIRRPKIINMEPLLIIINMQTNHKMFLIRVPNILLPRMIITRPTICSKINIPPHPIMLLET